MSRTALAEAVSFYDGLLQGEVLERTHETLLRRSNEGRTFYKGHSLYKVLRPRFVTPEQHAELQHAASCVTRALEAVYRRACQDATFRRELRLQEWEEFLMAVDADTRMPKVIGRLDGILGTDGVIRFIEYNPDPGGPIYSHTLASALITTPVMEAFGRRYEWSIPRTAPCLIDSLKNHHRLTGRGGVPQLAFFGPPGDDDSDEETLYREFISSQGLPLRIVTSEDDWSLRDGRLRVGDFEVDVVTFISANGFGGLIVGCGPEHPVMRALTTGAAHFMNGLFRSCVLRSKVLFAVLSTLSQSEMFEPEVRAALARHIPWSRVVREGRTPYGSTEVDLLPYIAEHRERLVLKPANEYGGTGVTLGWRTDADTWNATLKTALEESWIVQERVTLEPERYPVYDAGQVRYEALYADLNPFIWNDHQQEGFFIRLSAHPVLNLAQGAVSTPLMVIRER